MAGKLKWWEAAEIIGVTDRTMRRWRERYEEYGYDGLWIHRKRGRPSPKRIPVETMEKVLGLYREKYFDFNVRHFHEKLSEKHGIQLSYTLGEEWPAGRRIGEQAEAPECAPATPATAAPAGHAAAHGWQ